MVFEILGLKLYPANRFVSKVVENSWMKLNTLHYYLNYFVMIHALGIAYPKCLKDLLGADHYLYLYLCVPLHVPLCCRYLQSSFLHIVRKMDPNISAFIRLLISTSTRRQASSLSLIFHLNHWARALIIPTWSHAVCGAEKWPLNLQPYRSHVIYKKGRFQKEEMWGRHKT